MKTEKYYWQIIITAKGLMLSKEHRDEYTKINNAEVSTLSEFLLWLFYIMLIYSNHQSIEEFTTVGELIIITENPEPPSDETIQKALEQHLDNLTHYAQINTCQYYPPETIPGHEFESTEEPKTALKTTFRVVIDITTTNSQSFSQFSLKS